MKMDTSVRTINGVVEEIGSADRHLYSKWVADRHRLWKYDAWTVDAAIVDRMESTGQVQIEHRPSGVVYWLWVYEIIDVAIRVDNGFGLQYAVPRDKWRIK